MAIYHFSVKVVSRGAGQSAVASAAYQSGETLYSKIDEETKNYPNEERVDHTSILAPEKTPEWVSNRGALWNQAELAEMRKDSQLARKIIMALPRELTPDQNIELTESFCRSHFVQQGMISDIACHDLKSENPHAHIMLTTREVTSDGFGKKNRDWNKKEVLQGWRESWEHVCNDSLVRHGYTESISCRSHADLNLDKLPQIHVGYKKNPERIQRNNEIKSFNAATRDKETIYFEYQKMVDDVQAAIPENEKELKEQIDLRQKESDELGKLEGQQSNLGMLSRVFGQKPKELQERIGRQQNILEKRDNRISELQDNLGTLRHNESVYKNALAVAHDLGIPEIKKELLKLHEDAKLLKFKSRSRQRDNELER